MKVARLVCTALGVALLAGWATASSACEDHKAKTTTATAKAAKPAKVDGVAASTAGVKAGDACCMTGKVNAFADSNDPTIVVASSHGCAGKTTAVAAGSGGTCASKSAKASAMAGGSCTGHGMASMAAVSGHADCDACVDMTDCSGALDAAGAHRQTVRLKNGIMYVYTADSPRSVSAVQAAVARRVDRMARLASSGEKAHLCDECRAMRGAIASGKLNREVVNIEGGSLTLVTSNDPAVVAKLHALADEKVAVRAKM
jgi:hypothetical protein